MRAFVSLIALVAGIWLIYLGFERRESLAGKAESTLAQIGQRVDGGDHTTTPTKYFIAGGLLAIGGAFGLGIVRR